VTIPDDRTAYPLAVRLPGRICSIHSHTRPTNDVSADVASDVRYWPKADLG
jgi:hypothetical protein